MPRQRSAANRIDSALTAAGADVRVVAQSGTLGLLDARLPSDARERELWALEQFRSKAAPFYAAIRAGAEQYGQALRAELNGLAGGQAPASVMALAQAAVDAHSNCQLAQAILGHATSDLESLPTKKQPSRRLEISQLQRTAMGLDVVFSELVRKATAAAREEGRVTQAAPVAGLLTRIGAASPGPVPPFAPGGESALGPPPSKPNPSEKEGP